MAVIALTARDETFQRVRALTGIARLLLDVRLVIGLLVTFWMALRTDVGPVLVVATTVWMAFGLLFLLRWDTVGWILCTHPVLLALDGLGGFVLIASTTPVSPLLLLSGTGALLAGLCLDRRGAVWFSPLYGIGWLIAYAHAAPGTDTPAEIFLRLAVVPVLLVGCLFLGAGIREIVLRATRAERLLRVETRNAGVAEERARMAREMHDSLTKSLHGLALLAESLPAWVEKSPEKAGEQAGRLAKLIRNAGQESRAMITAMRQVDARGTVTEQVTAVVDRWRDATCRRATVSSVGEPALPTESAYELAAVLGEALENVRRHTPEAAAVDVRVSEEDGWVRMVVADDGPGVELDRLDRDGHFGVLGMRERAARVGGRLRITSRPGVGTVVDVGMPAALVAEDELAIDRPVVLPAADHGGSR